MEDNKIRPLLKPASGREFEGDSERKTAAYFKVREDLSTESTDKLPAEVGFEERSIQSFGRRRGRSLTDTQEQLLTTLLPSLSVDVKNMPKAKEYCLEIGFGNGCHLANIAKRSADNFYIGCEPYINGVVHLLNIIKCDSINNIAIYTEDARDLLSTMEDDFLSKVYLLFPDPWPKAKHHKRRLVTHETLALFAKKLKKNAELIIATDHLDYASWIYEFLKDNEFFELKKTFEECQSEPDNWIKTKYQQKAEALGIKPYFFIAKNQK
ncbi:tRNA (guanine-N(7)-)-methyltransferase [Candidatus Arcanobacter lacustris]|jgi:tRNA (guanine-N7-)-methyltransferase|uniref:tRNA (guanine-N(7)-)-methyltransferase n=1 Tax=Candidatus Arcanibacter lacustris TaxID=1607817 RepID=A0A0F5MS71_9RICK|nr:tRNA (guanine-N(7)-)-methyltransferase [Candidatus Arcanobacter lacustris]